MNKYKIFLTLTGYQLTWLACVFGESKFNQPMLGIYIGVTYLLIFFYLNKNKTRFLKISFLISLPGYLFDSIMVYFSIYIFDTIFIIGTLPIWMMVLWLSFSTLFDEILIFFERFKILGVVMSGFLGPITYYLGEPIGILNINNIILFFTFMIIFWSMLMAFYLKFIVRKY
tara:strand:+ start:1292 stop:1804 length:513 start_codon:yes stop_codon:yes gene_type:complete